MTLIVYNNGLIITLTTAHAPTYNITDHHTTGPHTVSVSVSAADLDQEESVTPVILSTPLTTPAHSAGTYIII